MVSLPSVLMNFLLPNTPIETRRFNELRLKITNKCPYNCYWCHNEGSGDRESDEISDIKWSPELEDLINEIRESLNISEIHFTGGEPTTNPELPLLVKNIKRLGFQAKITTIGAHSDRLISSIENGIDGINFSLYSLEPLLFHTSQKERTFAWAENQLRNQLATITNIAGLYQNTKINTVVCGIEDLDRVGSLLKWAQENKILVRLLPNLNNTNQSLIGIEAICKSLGATLIKVVTTEFSSDVTLHFRAQAGYLFHVKTIRNFNIAGMCSTCDLINTPQCAESFYGLRLENRINSADYPNGFYIRLCLHRTNQKTYIPVKSIGESKALSDFTSLVKSRQRRTT